MKTSFHLDLVVNGAQGRTPTVCLNFAPRTSEVPQQLFTGLLLTRCLLFKHDTSLQANVYRGRQYWPDYSWFKIP